MVVFKGHSILIVTVYKEAAAFGVIQDLNAHAAFTKIRVFLFIVIVN